MSRPDAALIAAQVELALMEDIGSGDLTANLIPVDAQANARVIAREQAVLCGTDWFDEVFRQVDASVSIDWQLQDGDHLDDQVEVCRIHGPARSILSAERAALNFLQTLSGTAGRAALYVQTVKGTGVRVLDTRKTVPGLRLAQKYAVRCGGASNHRIGLYDAILIKENHIEAAGSIAAALLAAQRLAGAVEIEVEVENMEELSQALDADAKRILLDNFDLAQLREAVAINQGRARLEASGGVNLQTIRDMALTGVDDISVGDITKDVKSVDFSMRFYH